MAETTTGHDPGTRLGPDGLSVAARGVSKRPRHHTHELELLHRLRVAGVRSPVPPDADDLVRRGLLVVGPSGCLLTDAGCELHERLLTEERRHLDLQTLAEDLARFEAARQLALRDGLAPAITALRHSGGQLPRFGLHADRVEALLAGDGPLDADALELALTQCHDDYALTLGEHR